MCWLSVLLFCSGTAFGQAPPLSWEVQEDLSGGADFARALTLSRRTAVVVGTAAIPGDGLDFVIQALRRSTGAVQWTDRVPSCCQSGRVVVTSLQRTVFAAGYVAGATEATDIVVRAYDAPTGQLRWSSIWDAGRDDLPQAIVASPTAVVVVGYGGNTPAHPPLDFLVRAYDPATGALLWQDQIAGQNTDNIAWAVAIDRRRVFVAGTTSTSSGRDLLMRAYTASTGGLEWEFGRPATSPVALQRIGGRVFVAGSTTTAPYLGALDPSSGALLWEDATGGPGIFRDVAVNGSEVVAVGSAGAGLLVRAYDGRTGSLMWEDEPPVLPGFGELAAAVALNDETVFVVGSSGQDFAYSEVLVRAYDASSGTLQWDDRSHRNVVSAAVDVALGPRRLFVAGYTSGVGSDFLIRAYDLRRQAPVVSPIADAER